MRLLQQQHLAPCSAAVSAAMVPAVPPPMTRTSQVSSTASSRDGDLASGRRALGSSSAPSGAGERRRGRRRRATAGSGGARRPSRVARRARAVGDPGPGRAEDGDAVAEEQRLVDVVGDEDDRGARCPPGPRRAGAASRRGSARRARRTARPSGPRAGAPASARASWTRWRMPPDRLCGQLVARARPGRPRSSQSSALRPALGARPTRVCASGSSTLRRTVRQGSSASSWKTRARSRDGRGDRARRRRATCPSSGRQQPGEGAQQRRLAAAGRRRRRPGSRRARRRGRGRRRTGWPAP